MTSLRARLPLAMLIAAAPAAGCSDPHALVCSNQVLREATSPDGRWSARVLERNCGATTPFERVVALRRADVPVWTAFLTQDVLFVMHGDWDVQLRWDGSGKLQISRPDVHEDVLRETDRWRDVSVLYVPPLQEPYRGKVRQPVSSGCGG